MTYDPTDYLEALDRASTHARDWLASVPKRPIPPSRTADELAAGFATELPDGPTDPAEVVDLLAAAAEDGLMAIGSGRFYGWVMGGVLPAALAADWLVSAWDQNTGIRFATPATAAAEEAAGGWLLDLLGLPEGCDVGFVTGGTMANFAGLAAGRQFLFTEVGWDIDTLGVAGGPPLTVLAGAERHDSVDLALRFLGLGAPSTVTADDQGRIVPEALAERLGNTSGPVLLVLQAGNVHSGAFDPFTEAIAAARSYPDPIWVHVDGAFGLFAGASPRLRHLVSGYEGADSWATDAHKTLNVPYDCGVTIVRRPAALRAAMGLHASYLIHAGEASPGDPLDKAPEMSRRARGVPVWAALRSLGRSGVAALVEGMVDHASALVEGLARVDGVEVLNDVPFTQICLSFGSDERTKAVTEALIKDGAVWMSGSKWRGRAVLRVSVSNWSSDDADAERSVDAIRRAMAAVSG